MCVILDLKLKSRNLWPTWVRTRCVNAPNLTTLGPIGTECLFLHGIGTQSASPTGLMMRLSSDCAQKKECILANFFWQRPRQKEDGFWRIFCNSICWTISAWEIFKFTSLFPYIKQIKSLIFSSSEFITRTYETLTPLSSYKSFLFE